MTDEETTPAERLGEHVRDFVNEVAGEEGDGPVLLRGAVVVWEEMRLDEDGDAHFSVYYSAVDGTTMAQTAGLLEIGREVLRQDMLDD